MFALVLNISALKQQYGINNIKGHNERYIVGDYNVILLNLYAPNNIAGIHLKQNLT